MCVWVLTCVEIRLVTQVKSVLLTLSIIDVSLAAVSLGVCFVEVLSNFRLGRHVTVLHLLSTTSRVSSGRLIDLERAGRQELAWYEHRAKSSAVCPLNLPHLPVA